MRLYKYITEAKANSPITKMIVNNVVEYAKRILGIQDINVTVKHRKSTSKKFGNVMLSRNPDYKPSKKQTIHIDLTRGYHILVSDILHEMTHIKQIVKRELTVQGSDIQWKGKTLISIEDYGKGTYDSHSKIPFEKEAYDNSRVGLDGWLISKEADQLRNSSDKIIQMIMDSF
jgi:hypothetical protein